MAWYDNQIIDSAGAFLKYDCECCDCYDPPPSISLDKFYEAMCVNPYYGWQFAQKPADFPGTPIPGSFTGKLCDQLVYEKCVNGCQVAGREDICAAIKDADRRFRDYVGFWPVPTEDCQEVVFPCGFLKGMLKLDGGKLLALGKISESPLDALAIPDGAFMDLDGNGVLDTVVLDIGRYSGTVRSVDEFIVKRSGDDCDDGPCGDEIRPICVKAHPTDTALYRLEIPIWLLVDKVKYNWLDPQALNPNDLTNYIRTVQLCRRFVDGTKAVTVQRRVGGGECSCSKVDGCYDCDTASACILDKDRSLIRLDLTNGGCGCFCDKCAERICIHYVSGECNGRWDDWIARLAASFLGRDVCCNPLGHLTKFWSADFIQTDSRGKLQSAITDGERANMFGTKRAGVELYRLLRKKRRLVLGTI